MRERLEAHIAAGRRVYGLWIAGEAAGVLVTDPAENELTALYVRPCLQDIGAGRAAAAFAVETLDSTRDMLVTVRSDNEKALRLYESLGFIRATRSRPLNDKGVREETRLRPAGALTFQLSTSNSQL